VNFELVVERGVGVGVKVFERVGWLAAEVGLAEVSVGWACGLGKVHEVITHVNINKEKNLCIWIRPF
jgi:hypothetical protein